METVALRMGWSSFPSLIGCRLGGLETALAVILAVTAAPAAAAPTISGLQVQPPRFSPNGDQVQDSTELIFVPSGAESALLVDVDVVLVANDSTVATLLSGASRASGVEVREPWAPLAGSVPEGRYRFDVLVSDSTGQSAAGIEVVADTTAPTVLLRDFSQDPFDPDDTPLTLHLDVVSDTSTFTVVTARVSGVDVADLGSAQGSGVTALQWVGTFDGGAQAGSGNYEIRAYADDFAGNTAASLRTVTLDRDAPFVTLDQGDTVQTTSFPVSLTGVATDDHLVEDVLHSLDGQTFTSADSVSMPAEIVGFEIVVDDLSPQPGFRAVIVRSVDRYGHVSADRFPVIAYDTLMPAAFSSMLLGAPAQVQDGDSVTVISNWNAPDLQVSADFSKLDSGGGEIVLSGDPLSQGPEFAYRGGHRITPTNNRTPGSREIIVRATTGVLSAADTIEVTLADRHGADLVSVDRNRFDPLAGQTVTIASERSTAPVVVEAFDLSGRRVRLLEGSGFVVWDGRNDRGDDVASGVYLLKVRVDGAEEVRRVAVLRGGSR